MLIALILHSQPRNKSKREYRSGKSPVVGCCHTGWGGAGARPLPRCPQPMLPHQNGVALLPCPRAKALGQVIARRAQKAKQPSADSRTPSSEVFEACLIYRTVWIATEFRRVSARLSSLQARFHKCTEALVARVYETPRQRNHFRMLTPAGPSSMPSIRLAAAWCCANWRNGRITPERRASGIRLLFGPTRFLRGPQGALTGVL